jgi:hypothetical protein
MKRRGALIPEGTVDWDLIEIGSKSMAVGVGVGEEPSLQKWSTDIKKTEIFWEYSIDI